MNQDKYDEEHLLSEYMQTSNRHSIARQDVFTDEENENDHLSKYSPISSTSTTFIGAIEGLRGVAVVMTMYTHIVDQPYVLREVAGTTGVTVFFVLSGFLITGVLIRLQEKTKVNTSSFSIYRHLGRFYLDRTFRLLPALILMLSVTYLLRYYSGQDSAGLTTVRNYALLSLFYLSNFQSLWPQSGWTGPFGQTWSLACEEQFYIGWAFVLPWIVKLPMRYRTLVIVTLTGISLFARIYSGMYPGVLFGAHWRFGLITNVWKMFLGSSLRLLPVPSILRHPMMTYLGLAGLGFQLYLCDKIPFDFGKIAPGWGDVISALTTFTDPLSAAFTAFILTGLHGISATNWILETKLLRFLGKVSYSWYLWQVTLIEFRGWQRNWPAFSDTCTALVFAIFSTFLVEEPILRWYKGKKA